MKIKITKIPNSNKLAYGGEKNPLGGADFTNGVTFINEGGTHEQNPLQGVPMGVDKEGTPNLVEEGEIIWNDYVFSNRLTPNKKLLNQYGFPEKYEDYSFAKIAEELQKESAERPNDIISKKGLQDNMQTLIMIQEAVREKKNKNNPNMFSYGGGTDDSSSPSKASLSEKLKTQELNNRFFEDDEFINFLEELEELGYFRVQDGKPVQKLKEDTDKTTPKPVEKTTSKPKEDIKKTTPTYTPPTEEEIRAALKETGRYPNNTKGKKALEEEVEKRMSVYKGESVLTPITDFPGNQVPYKPLPPPKVDPISRVEPKESFDWSALGDSMMRLSPLFANMANLVMNLKKPDYSEGDRVLEAANAAPVSNIQPEVEDVNIRPIDRNYLLNQTRNQGNAMLNQIRNSGLSAQNALANMLTTNAQTQQLGADALLKTDESNLARMLQEAEFNKANDQFRTQTAFQNFANNADRYKGILGATQYSSAYNTNIDQARAQGITGALSNIGTDLSGIGTENVWRKAIEELPALLYTMTGGYKNKIANAAAAGVTSGTTPVGTKSPRKYGGRLLTRKRRK